MYRPLQLRSVQSGFAAVAAVFLLVVLAALGAYMVSFSNTQQLTSAQDVQGSRAYWAARAGLEWGIAGVAVNCPTSPTSLTIDVFSVTITCTKTSYTDSGAVNIFQLTSIAKTAGSAGGVGYIERSVSASMEN
jgi:MSHA biogenesis protein MshP